MKYLLITAVFFIGASFFKPTIDNTYFANKTAVFDDSHRIIWVTEDVNAE